MLKENFSKEEEIRLIELRSKKSYSSSEFSELIKLQGKLRKVKILERVSEKTKNLISEFSELSDSEKKSFLEYFNIQRYPDLSHKQNPISTKEEAENLWKALVDAAIKTLSETGNTEISEIDFRIDGLIESVKYGKWTPASDSSIMVCDENRNILHELY